ncbi:glutaredoxin family protein [Lacisediminimonas sp.]|uniref:glutaredoxin family protein n=1 Tax=Lacisediminimonas sp. TaxID=3060582 RepID=UPI002715B13E|nr:DUF4124 domain-containing protein [Lacisediminimonas sp.]MDO8299074.1 DUF4124 domain-containing protein [Lacisediminimonas sp.]
MKPACVSLSLLAAIAMLAAGTASAQLYKWTGPDGKVNYTDTPPPRDARNVEARSRSGEGSGPLLPFALQQVVTAHPVTLYTMKNCAPCDDGRKLLAARGIPVSEKTVTSNDDIAALRALAGGAAQLPLLSVGKQRQQGYEPNAWNQLLSAAGYPAESRLPAGWRNAAPAPLSPPEAPKPVRPTESAPAGEAAREVQPAAPAQGNAPPGFRF